MTQPRVVLVDYGLGNLFSVQQAFRHFGIEAVISDDGMAIASTDALVVPGVGAFPEAMQALRSRDLVAPIIDFIATGKPFLGICLGLQLLFDESEEFGSTKGLGVVPGVIRKFDFTSASQKVAVPQIAWNRIYSPDESHTSWAGTPLRDTSDGAYMYFVHSYFVQPSDPQHVLCETRYEGFRYCSAILKDNVFATQFHPEKSAFAGLSIYKNWIARITSDD